MSSCKVPGHCDEYSGLLIDGDSCCGESFEASIFSWFDTGSSAAGIFNWVETRAALWLGLGHHTEMSFSMSATNSGVDWIQISGRTSDRQSRSRKRDRHDHESPGPCFRFPTPRSLEASEEVIVTQTDPTEAHTPPRFREVGGVTCSRWKGVRRHLPLRLVWLGRGGLAAEAIGAFFSGLGVCCRKNSWLERSLRSLTEVLTPPRGKQEPEGHPLPLGLLLGREDGNWSGVSVLQLLGSLHHRSAANPCPRAEALSSCPNTSPNGTTLGACVRAGGFEPPITAPKAAALPLGYALERCILGRNVGG